MGIDDIDLAGEMMWKRHVVNIVSLFMSGALIFGATAEAQLRSDLRVFSDSFISPSFEATEKTNYQFAGMTLRSSPQSDDAIKMNIEGAVAFSAPPLNYLNSSEFYFQAKTSD